MTNKDVDIASFQFSQKPYDVYEHLRQSGNIHFLPKNNKWFVIGFNEVVQIAKDTSTFTSTGNHSFDPILLNCDPPKHTVHRKILSSGDGIFSSNRIDQLELVNTQIATRLIQQLKRKDVFDVLIDFSLPFSSFVILNLLGFSTKNSQALRDWSISAVSSESIHHSQFAQKKWIELKPSLLASIRELISNPQSNTLSEILLHSYAQENFSDEDILNLTKVLLLGGNETTPNLIASALNILLRDESLLRQVRENPTLLDSVINETLRLEAPTQIIERTAIKDATISGVKIPKGSAVSLAIGAANRDPAIFEKPHQFLLNREKSKILSFGFGPHYCLGAHLAKQEARIGLELLLVNFPKLNLQPNQSFSYRHSSHIHGFTKLLVRAKVGRSQTLEESRRKAFKLLKESQLQTGEFPTFENYPNSIEGHKLWQVGHASPFVHSNIIYCLKQLKNNHTFAKQIQSGVDFIESTREEGDVWRFWKLQEGINNVPPDIDDTALCSFILCQNEKSIQNRSLLLSTLQKDNTLSTWLLPRSKVLFLNFRLYFKWLGQKKAYLPTLKANMFANNDAEIGVMANALLYLGENKDTKKIINYCVDNWKQSYKDGHFYTDSVVVNYHIARAFKEGLKSFDALIEPIVKLLKIEQQNFTFSELVLAGLILKYFNKTHLKIFDTIKNQVNSFAQDELFEFPHFGYFTSKDRNYRAGSNSLVAAWYLELSEVWV